MARSSREVIDWRTCIDPRAQNHLSLPINRHVYRLLAEILVGTHTTRETGEARVLAPKALALAQLLSSEPHLS